MQTLSMILAIASTFSAALAAPAAATPEGLIKAFIPAECIGAGGAGGALNGQSINLPKGQCMNITPPFSSFQGGRKVACPKGKTATVMAYPDDNCMGEGVSAGTLPTSDTPGECKEIVINSSSGGVTAGGRSAKFTCA